MMAVLEIPWAYSAKVTELKVEAGRPISVTLERNGQSFTVTSDQDVFAPSPVLRLKSAGRRLLARFTEKL
jgi:hypothetical protein